jgi:hypothetical protein
MRENLDSTGMRPPIRVPLGRTQSNSLINNVADILYANVWPFGNPTVPLNEAKLQVLWSSCRGG